MWIKVGRSNLHVETHLSEVTTTAALAEKKKLRKGFSRFDMICYTVVAVIGLNALGAFAANGAQALTWLVLSAVTFFLPYGLLVAELGSTFPQEGGIYEWCKLAGGRLYAALAATFYWITVPLLMGGSATVGIIAAIKIFWLGDASVLFGSNVVTDVLVELALALLFIWGITVGAIMSLRRGKWISTVGFFVKLALLSVFLVLAGISVVSGSSKGSHVGLADLVPANWGLVASSILPVLIFLWLGVEMQSSAAEEMVNAQRDVPRAVLRAGIIVVILYSMFLLAILFALPTNQLSSVGSFLNAFQTVNRVLPTPLSTALGWLVALGFATSLFASGATLLISVSRTYAIAALDRAAPLRLGHISRTHGTPSAAAILCGMVATMTAVASILIAAFGSENIGALFVQVLGVAISTVLLAYLLMFPTFLILRYKYPAVPRRYRVPGGLVGAWIVTLLPMAYVGIACFFLLIPSDVYLQNNHLDRLTFELTHFLPLACIVLLTIVLYIWGQREKQNRDVLVELGGSPSTES
jgi:glutamate:GABA antiporter